METKELESNKKIASRFFEYFSKGDIQQIENLWGSDYKLHYPGKPQYLSKEESKQLLKEYISGFPELKFTVEGQVAENDIVATRITISGTQKGTFQGIPPSNKKITATGICIHRFVNNKIVEEWVELDALGLMTQLGVVPEMATAQR